MVAIYNVYGKVIWEDKTRADLYGANLCSADLCSADLRSADLCGANLCSADLCSADLCGANLCGANLCSANLRGANLCSANLCSANLRGANLCSADLRSANLCSANLCSADLRSAENISELTAAQTLITPEGDLIGYKKLADGTICKLKIPADAMRFNATGRKCRAEFAIVLEGEGISTYDSSFIYKIGEIVRPREAFNENRWTECASGIHFFLTRIEAENYS